MNYSMISDIKKYIVFSLTDDSQEYAHRKSKDLTEEINVLLNDLGYTLPIPKSAILTKKFLNRIISIGTAGYVVLEYGQEKHKYIAEQYLYTFNEYFKKIKNKEIIFSEIPIKMNYKNKKNNEGGVNE